MKWIAVYLVGFAVLLVGALAALSKMGVLARIGATWTVIGVLMMIGLGIMVSVSRSGTKENVEIDRR